VNSRPLIQSEVVDCTSNAIEAIVSTADNTVRIIRWFHGSSIWLELAVEELIEGFEGIYRVQDLIDLQSSLTRASGPLVAWVIL